MVHPSWVRWYIKKGLPVLPLWPVEDGRCACGKPVCGSPGKHPLEKLVPHGSKDATLDLRTAEEWWLLWPDANIGIATGEEAGVFVVDIDDWQSWQRLMQMHGEVYPGWISYSQKDGVHAWFMWPGEPVANSQGTVAAGVDVRGEGGYVVAPPSKGLLGSYVWDKEANPASSAFLYPAPDWLLRRIWSGRGESGKKAPYVAPPKIIEGGRNGELIRMAGACRHHGADPDEIEALLQSMNKRRCTPPLDPEEVRKIAWSSGRWEPAPTLRVGAREEET